MRRIGLVVLVLAIVAAAFWLLRRGLGPEGDESRGATSENGGPEPIPVSGAGPAARSDAGALAARPESARPPESASRVTGPRVNGRVVDASGKGIAGARVLSLPDTNSKTFFAADAGKEGSPALGTIADTEGRFVVPVATDSPFFTIYADAKGFSPNTTPPVPPERDVTIVLQTSASLRGVVTNVDGAPIAGARVQALVMYEGVRIELEAVTDAAGAYSIDGLPVQPEIGTRYPIATLYNLATADGYAPVFSESALTGIKPASVRTRDFTLTAGATLVGKVIDADAQTPIADARVFLWSIEGMQSHSRTSGESLSNPWGPRPLGETKSAADGTFRFEHIPSQGKNPVNSHNFGRKGGMVLGHVGATKEGFASSSDQVPVPADGATVEVDLRLWPSAVVMGRVIDEAGKPVAGADVGANSKDRTASAVPAFYENVPRAWTKTDTLGHYRIEGVAVSRAERSPMTISASLWDRSGAGWGSASVPKGEVVIATNVGATVEAPDIVLHEKERMLRVAVRVLAPDGRPSWGAALQRVDSPSFGGQQRRTDANGRTSLVFQRPAPGVVLKELPFVVRAEGCAPASFMATPSESGDERTIQLTAGHQLSGRVLRADRSPASRAGVTIANGNVPIADAAPDEKVSWGQPIPKPGQPALIQYGFAQTSDDGTFTIVDLPEGPYHVVASVPPRVGGMQAKPLRAIASNVAADTPGLELILPIDNSPPTGSLEGSVLDGATGKPASNFTITVSRGTVLAGFATDQRNVGMPAPSYGSVTAEGRFTFDAIPVGTWTVIIRSDGFAPAQAESVEVAAGETRRLPPITLGTGITVIGAARAGTDVSLKGRKLGLTPVAADGQAYGSAAIAEDGSFRIPKMLAGQYRVAAYPENAAGESAPTYIAQGGALLTIPPGATEFRFDTTLEVAGVLSIVAGDPRLPPGPWDSKRPTDEQKKFGEGLKLVLRRADGSVVIEQKGFTLGGGGALSFLPLPPGAYVLRWEILGEPPRDVPVTLEAGRRVEMGLPK